MVLKGTTHGWAYGGGRETSNGVTIISSMESGGRKRNMSGEKFNENIEAGRVWVTGSFLLSCYSIPSHSKLTYAVLFFRTKKVGNKYFIFMPQISEIRERRGCYYTPHSTLSARPFGLSSVRRRRRRPSQITFIPLTTWVTYQRFGFAQIVVQEHIYP